MIPPLAWLLFMLVPLGGVLLAVGIRTVRRSFFGPLVAELAMDRGATTFTVQSPGVFGLWCKWPMFQRSPLDAVQPVVIDDATGIAVPLRHAFFRPHGNDGVTGWFEFRRFSAAAGSYRLELIPGSGIPTAFERIVHRVVPLPQADPSRCAIQVRESQSAVWLAAGISLLVLAGHLLIGGLVGGILLLALPAAAAEPAAADPCGFILRLERAETLDAATVADLLEAELHPAEDDQPANWRFFQGRPRADGARAADLESIDLRLPGGPEAAIGPLLAVAFSGGRGPTQADVVAACGEADDVRPLPPGHPARLALAYDTPRGRLVLQFGPAPASQVVSFVIDRTCLTAPRAAALARRPEPLRLDGLDAISADVARALAPHRGLLSLEGVRRVDDETAAALAGHAGPLAMHGLEAIDSAVLFAKILGDVPQDTTWHLFDQERLRSLTDAQVAAIARHGFAVVMLSRAALTEQQAALLAAAPGDLCVGADHLSDAALARLAERAAGLSVVAGTLSAEQARILAAARGPLVVRVVDLPRSAAAILETRTGPLELSTGPEPSVP